MRLLLTLVQDARFAAIRLGWGGVDEKGAKLLARVKDQEHPMLAELSGRLLAEAAQELVGGGGGHGEGRRTHRRPFTRVRLNTRTGL